MWKTPGYDQLLRHGLFPGVETPHVLRACCWCCFPSFIIIQVIISPENWLLKSHEHVVSLHTEYLVLLISSSSHPLLGDTTKGLCALLLSFYANGVWNSIGDNQHALSIQANSPSHVTPLWRHGVPKKEQLSYIWCSLRCWGMVKMAYDKQ